MSPPSWRKEDKAKRAGMIERETGRWRDGDEGGACSACLDVNNAPEGSAANCQLLIFVVSFNHLRLCTPPLLFPSLAPTLLHLTPPPPTRHAKKRMNILHICISARPPSPFCATNSQTVWICIFLSLSFSPAHAHMHIYTPGSEQAVTMATSYRCFFSPHLL